jgi:hypothetical protein
MRSNTAAFAQYKGDNKYIFISRLSPSDMRTIPAIIGQTFIEIGQCDPMKADDDTDQIEWHLDHCILSVDKFPIFRPK